MRTMTRTMALTSAFALLQACATARVKVAQEGAPGRRYEQVAVPPFGNEVGAALPASAPENVAGTVIAKLQKTSAFSRVDSVPDGAAGELVVRGNITEYDPGSKALRFILIGLGAGGLQLDVTLVDGLSGEIIERFETSGEIMAGGVMGASMSIDDMIASAAEKIAARTARWGATGGER